MRKLRYLNIGLFAILLILITTIFWVRADQLRVEKEINADRQFQLSSFTPEISKELVDNTELVDKTTKLSNFESTAPYAAIYTSDMDEVYSKNSADRIAPASTTKILTAATALTYLKPDDILTVGDELDLVHPGSSLCYLRKGQKLTLRDALIGMLLPSGNDAAYVIATNTADLMLLNNDLSSGEKVNYFCSLMNNVADSYGIKDSNFVNPEGWDNPNHYTTVEDLAKITSCAMEFEVIREIVALSNYTGIIESGETLRVRNTNPLVQPGNLYYRDNAIGVKTGYTDNAGRCLVGAVSNSDGEEYIVLAMGCSDLTSRNQAVTDMIDMIEW